jgi:hypothetical protein
MNHQSYPFYTEHFNLLSKRLDKIEEKIDILNTRWLWLMTSVATSSLSFSGFIVWQIMSKNL